MAYTTWNPSDRVNVTLSNGNLTAVTSGNGSVRSVASVNSGKIYFEITFSSIGAAVAVGIANAAATLSSVMSTGTNAAICGGGGAIAINGTAQTGVGAFTGGTACGIAVDMGGKLIWFRNGAAGNWNGSGTANPATGAGGYSFGSLPGGATVIYALAGATGSGLSTTANFGGAAFSGAVPSGFTSGFPATPTGGPMITMVM